MRTTSDESNARVRRPAVANLFYPGGASTLERTVDELLARMPISSSDRAPKALIVPHAGYVYSGPIAATGYATLRSAAKVIRRVVLLGPAHRVFVRGCAVPDVDAFATPLGTVPIDHEAIRRIEHLPGVTHSERAHAPEHSLEVQLPFLQRVLERFTLVPLVVGDASPREIATVLETLWGGDETLIVISSDLSHYLPYDDARRIDDRTIRRIVSLDPAPLDHELACGATPVNGLLEAARDKGLVPTLLDLRNSGDTSGQRDQVVGYASVAFHGAA